MSSDLAITVNDVSKCYRVYRKPLHRLQEKILGGRKRLCREVWALRNVTLEVKQGETLGIIGRNGSGKSTLLELISDTLTPSSGAIEVNGRIAALLELGAGFNPEFTGRENVYLNAAIIGIPKEEMEERYPKIVEFSEIGSFIDQPVKTYSSGMYVRLAFAVAINLDPEILIVDEALSVGDVRFQRKCFRKFQELQKRGKTILFVTHATDLVIAHCSRAIFLDGGEVRDMGEPRDVVHSYLNFLFGKQGGANEEARRASSESRGGDEISESPDGLAAKLPGNAGNDGCVKRIGYNASEYRWGDRRAMIVDYLLQCKLESIHFLHFAISECFEHIKLWL